MCYYIASYLKLKFCRPGGVFWPFLDPREAKKGKKKVNRQTPDKKNHRQKKLTNTGYFAEKKSWLYDNQPQSYIRLLLVVFFVATRYIVRIPHSMTSLFSFLPCMSAITKHFFYKIFFKNFDKGNFSFLRLKYDLCLPFRLNFVKYLNKRSSRHAYVVEKWPFG